MMSCRSAKTGAQTTCKGRFPADRPSISALGYRCVIARPDPIFLFDPEGWLVRSAVMDCHHTNENQGAEQEVTLLQHEENSSEYEKSVHGEVYLIDTSILMGDPIFPLQSAHSLTYDHFAGRVVKAGRCGGVEHGDSTIQRRRLAA